MLFWLLVVVRPIRYSHRAALPTGGCAGDQRLATAARGDWRGCGQPLSGDTWEVAAGLGAGCRRYSGLRGFGCQCGCPPVVVVMWWAVESRPDSRGLDVRWTVSSAVLPCFTGARFVWTAGVESPVRDGIGRRQTVPRSLWWTVGLVVPLLVESTVVGAARAPHRHRLAGIACWTHPPRSVAPAAGSVVVSILEEIVSSARAGTPTVVMLAGTPGCVAVFSHESRCVATVGTPPGCIQRSLQRRRSCGTRAVVRFTAELRCVARGRHPVSRRSPELRCCTRWGTPTSCSCPAVRSSRGGLPRPAVHGPTAVARLSAFVAGDGRSGNGRYSVPALAALGRAVPPWTHGEIGTR